MYCIGCRAGFENQSTYASSREAEGAERIPCSLFFVPMVLFDPIKMNLIVLLKDL